MDRRVRIHFAAGACLLALATSPGPAGAAAPLFTAPADGQPLEFGEVLVGSSRLLPVQIANGGSEPLSGTLEDPAGAFFLVGPQELRLDPGEGINRQYGFAPSLRGPASAPVTVRLGEASATLTLRGVGVAPVSSVDLSGADAGAVRVGEEAWASYTLANLGDGNRSGDRPRSNLEGRVSGGGGFFSVLQYTISLPDGQRRTVRHRFAPRLRGEHTAPVTVSLDNGNPDGSNTPHGFAFELRGRGVGPVFRTSLSPRGPNPVGAVKVGETAIFRFELANDSRDLGEAAPDPRTDLTVLSASFTGPDAPRFHLLGLPRTLSEGESATVDLFFTPDEVRTFFTNLVVVTDQGAPVGQPGRAFRFHLTGQGLVAGCAGDLDGDGDVDGSDETLLLARVDRESLAPVFGREFGRTRCPGGP
ncbi:MAG: hypothetical protein Kow0092_00670 [Deferrisomatales bacterium]